MKILMFQFEEYSYSLNADQKKMFADGIIVFTHVESKDEENSSKVVTKYIKNIKWFAGKFNKKEIILHSFAHLSDDKATPEFAKEVLKQAEERLKNSGYDAKQTPYGYVLNFELKMDNAPLARFFKSF